MTIAAIIVAAGRGTRAGSALPKQWHPLLGPQLTSKGCEHLTADLNYLVNVFSALGVAGHPHPLVTHISTLATLSDGDLETQIKSRNKASEVENALRAVEARIALRRGISIS